MFWGKYHDVILKYIDLNQTESRTLSHKNITMDSFLYSGEYVTKARITDINQGVTAIYNNLIYPKTGSNLPCFGMDLMAFNEKKVILTFDFQHPKPHYDFNHDIVRDCMGEYAGCTKEIRFFEAGNHFSRYVFVRKCNIDEIEQYLPDFEKYISTYAKLLNYAKPTGNDITEFVEFDKYMIELDPVIGFMISRFGKEIGGKYVDEFLFEYAKLANV